MNVLRTKVYVGARHDKDDIGKVLLAAKTLADNNCLPVIPYLYENLTLVPVGDMGLRAQLLDECTAAVFLSPPLPAEQTIIDLKGITVRYLYTN